jgi:predicted MFS family arabinose efflux permease
MLHAIVGARAEEFTPEVRRALRIEVPAAVLFTVFTALTSQFNGLFLRRELGASPLQLALLPVATAVCLLLSIAWVRLINVRAPLSYVVWSSFAGRALFLLTLFIGSPWPFLGILVAGNLLSTLAGPAQAALIEQVYPRAQRGRAISLVRMVGAVCGIVAMPLAGVMVGVLDYRWGFAAGAVCGMAASIRLRGLPVRGSAGEAPDRPRLREGWAALRADRTFQRLLLAMFVFGSGVWFQIPANTLMVADILAATPGQVGLFAACAAVAALAGNAYWGRRVDRCGSQQALRAVFAVGLITPLLYYVAPSPWMLVATSVSDSLLQTGVDLVWLMVVIDVAGPRRVAPYMAISSTLAGVRGILGPLLSAVVIEHLGVRAVYLVAAGVMTCGWWLLRPAGAPASAPVGVVPATAAGNG